MIPPLPPRKESPDPSHGEEWVSFYESFDKLVQDHLSRSSELLRRAMSLPEVADREVAQVRDALERRLAHERGQTSRLLTELRAQIGNSHRLASTLAMSIGSLTTDLHRLSQRIDEAIQSPAASAGRASEPHDTPAGEAPGPATTAETPPMDHGAFAWAEVSSTDERVVEETGGDAAGGAETPGPKRGSSAHPGARQRPHWLSATRVGASRPTP